MRGRGVAGVAALGGGAGLGDGAQAGQAGVPGGGADLAQLVPDVPRGPGGLDRVGVAQVQQPAIRHAAHIRTVGRGEGGQGLVPGGPGIGGGRDRFGADRVGRVVVAGQFAPGADDGGSFLPFEPVQRVSRDRSERGGGPGRGVAGGVLADPLLARVHQRGDLGDVGLAGGVGKGGNLLRPGPGRKRDQDAETVADAGVQDGGDVAGSGQVPFGDRPGQGLGGVQVGQFDSAQGAP